jgi:hypothetical protein
MNDKVPAHHGFCCACDAIVSATLQTGAALTYSRTIVCLANSRKYSGRCIAGLELNGSEPKGWIRPVSSASKGELQFEHLYVDGGEPELLDLIQVEFLQPRPAFCHREDHLINAKSCWTRRGALRREELVSAIEPEAGCLWFDGGSTKFGINDKIPADAAAQLTSSLKLVQPKSLFIKVQTEGGQYRQPRSVIRGFFSLAGFDYTLSVTDGAIEREFLDARPGATKYLRSPLLCLSVSELFESQNACYKLIAGVIA